jgi:uncharacterized protein (TIGR03067 family)
MTRFAVPALALTLTALVGGCQKSDRQLAQGEWAIAFVESPDGAPGPGEVLKDLAVVVKGDRISITHTTSKERVSALFTLDPTKDPKELDAPEVFVSREGADEVTAPVAGHGIYKFEGDELVIAMSVGVGKDQPRPTEFKPSVSLDKNRTVLVFHLKRK